MGSPALRDSERLWLGGKTAGINGPVGEQTIACPDRYGRVTTLPECAGAPGEEQVAQVHYRNEPNTPRLSAAKELPSSRREHICSLIRLPPFLLRITYSHDVVGAGHARDRAAERLVAGMTRSYRNCQAIW